MPGFLDTVLRSEKHPIYLRNPQVSDATAYARIFSNPENIKDEVSTSEETMSVEDAERLITAMRKSAAEDVPTRVNFVVMYTGPLHSSEDGPGGKQNGNGDHYNDDEKEGEERGEGIIIGVSGFGGIDLIDGKRHADVGALIEPEYRRRGYALECFRLSIDFAFDKLKTEAVSCQTLAKNTAMVGLVTQKLGWTETARTVTASHGEEVRFEMSPEQWTEMKKRVFS